MKVGDIVEDNRLFNPERVGVIISVERISESGIYKAFKVLWRDGTIGNNIWDYHLELARGYR